MKKEKRGISKIIIVLCILILLMVCAIIFIVYRDEKSKPAKVYQEGVLGGDISLTYTDDKNLFAIENVLQTSDSVGVLYDSAELFFDFTVNVELDAADNVEYEILLIKDEDFSTALNNNIKVYLEKEIDGKFISVVDPVEFVSDVDDKKYGETVMSLYKSSTTSNVHDNYRLRMWLSDSAVFDQSQVQNYAVKIGLRGISK